MNGLVLVYKPCLYVFFWCKDGVMWISFSLHFKCSDSDGIHSDLSSSRSSLMSPLHVCVFTLGSSGFKARGKMFEVKSTSGKLLFSADEQEVVVGAERLRVMGECPADANANRPTCRDPECWSVRVVVGCEICFTALELRLTVAKWKRNVRFTYSN